MPLDLPIAPVETRIPPRIHVPETIGTGLGDKKVGQRVRAIVDYIVIEETKSYVVLRVNGFFLSPARRTF